jgi:hypothetical protein
MPLKSTDVSEEHFASTFRVKEEAKQETTVKQVANSTGFFFGLLFDFKMEATCFLRNVG